MCSEVRLRMSLQGYQSRCRRAIRQLNALQQRMAQLVLPLPVMDAAELLTTVEMIRALLSDEEVPYVRS